MRILTLSILLMSLSLFGCKSSKKAMKEETNNEEITEQPQEGGGKVNGEGYIPLVISDFVVYAEEDLRFQYDNVKIQGHYVTLSVRYGGGCKEHDFRLFSTGEKDQAGNVQLWLLDFTHDDMCKAFIHKDLTLDLKPLFKHTQDVTGFTINKNEVLYQLVEMD